MGTTLCLLTLNELKGCQLVVPTIDRSAFDDIYAVDGGSKDGTAAYLQGQGIPVHIQKRRGLNAACWEAIEHCRTEYLVFFHPKGTVPAADAIRIKHAMENDGYDFVVASRNLPGGRNEEDDSVLKPRKWFVSLLALVAAVLWRREGNVVWDVLHGFRGVKRSAFILMAPPGDSCTVDIAMVVQSYKKRIRRLEIPTVETPRSYGKTHFKALPTGSKLLAFLMRELLGQNDPGALGRMTSKTGYGG